ncbi:cytochrome c oxidase subunit IV [Halteromyces radiatus]|uniref:cytochrome c oxidase subunit IV n=1 Tax=Halteromyces radiatus TaxID=101107 RepID=UPI00221F0EDE|nr:cytochrome c oxidase subunit IV [Halteromyces radiatus]KAI8100128.1 cytochrome c oxidase subunit IV [Halteromyces radiatus]
MLRSTSLARLSLKRVTGLRYNSNVTVESIPKRWTLLSTAEQNTIAKQLEELQKKEWTALSKEEKAACYYVSFGPHGPRTPIQGEGHTFKVILGVGVVLTVSTIFFLIARAKGQEVPPSMNKEWQEATNEYLKSQNSNPISGISSESYKGKGYVSKV